MSAADDQTFPLRLVAGLIALGILATVDLVRHPRNPTRVKEYGFLFAVAGGTMAFGLVHDLITSSISAEYFTLGKGIPEAAAGFCWPVARLSLMASWSAGLFIGLVLLVGNNPKPGVRQLTYRALARNVRLTLLYAVMTASVGGLGGLLFAPELEGWLGLDLLDLEDTTAFIVVSGIHAGTYVGGLVGVVIAALLVWSERKQPVLTRAAFGERLSGTRFECNERSLRRSPFLP